MSSSDNTISLDYSYIEGADAVVDVGFLWALPNRAPREPVRVLYTERGAEIKPAHPDPFGGTVILSGVVIAGVNAIASIVKSWLQNRRTRLSFTSSSGNKLEYEGPGLNKTVEQIASELSRLASDGATLHVHPVKLSPDSGN